MNYQVQIKPYRFCINTICRMEKLRNGTVFVTFEAIFFTRTPCKEVNLLKLQLMYAQSFRDKRKNDQMRSRSFLWLISCTLLPVFLLITTSSSSSSTIVGANRCPHMRSEWALPYRQTKCVPLWLTKMMSSYCTTTRSRYEQFCNRSLLPVRFWCYPFIICL